MSNIEKVFQLKINNQSEKETNSARNRMFIIAGALMAVVFVASFGTTFYFYKKYRNAVKNPILVAQDEESEITKKIEKFMELPSEDPTMATVTDKEKLKDQLFFANAQNGDKVLIYAKAQKAFLYRPSENKLIEMMTLSDSQIGSLQDVQKNQNSTVSIPVEE